MVNLRPGHEHVQYFAASVVQFMNRDLCLLYKGIYSQGSNTDQLKTESIRKPNIFKFCIGIFGFQMVGSIDVYSYSYSYGTDHSKTEHLETYKMAALA